MKQGINPNFHDYSIDNSMEDPWFPAEPWLDFVSTRHGFNGYTHLEAENGFKPAAFSSLNKATRVTILKSLIFRILRVKYPYIQKQTLIVTTCQSFVFASFWAKSNQIVRNHKFLTFITMNGENFRKIHTYIC